MPGQDGRRVNRGSVRASNFFFIKESRLGTEVEIVDRAIIVDPDAVAGDCLLAPGSNRHNDRASQKISGADCEEACGAGAIDPEGVTRESGSERHMGQGAWLEVEADGDH
ncbi:hypothetical protein NDU88_001515 [Pleurodeles waltl]|uniref:Uncharacterized protein n=1 Tax=Pleurodeles waltl TaxID=8319 RepID=A0AAV7UWA0_PLEWA|nr:hypothetical protein NDU88_001515 [Pleurodeles waltl]